MRASELLLIVRAQNQASAALRRVAGDVRGLSKIEGLKQRGQALQLARQQSLLQRSITANELKSLTTGKRAIGLSRDRLAAEMAMENAMLRRSRVQDSMAAREAQALRNRANISRLERGVKAAPTRAVRTELAQRLAAAQIDSQRLGERQDFLRRKMDLASTSIEKQGMNLKALAAREAEAAARTDVLRNRLANYGDRLRLNTQQINANNRAINAARWDKVAAGGRILQHSARVAQYAGLVLGGSLAAAANFAAKFDTNVTLAATQTRRAGQSFLDTAKNSKIMQRDIMSLMTQFPASADDFSKAAYDIFSSTDVSFGGGRKLLKLFAQAAVAGMTDVQTATDAGIVVLNNFGNNVNLMPRRLQRMFAAVRFGRMTFQQFATSMSTIGPAARAANQSFDSMAGTFAFLTRHLDVAKARVGYARVLEALSSPKMLAGLKEAGVTIEDTNHRLLPLDQILGKLIKRFPGLRDGGTDAMNFFKNISNNQGTMQARRAFTFLVQFFDRAGKDGASYLDMLRKVKGDNNEFTQSLAAMEKTTGVRWGVFVNQLKALALAIGSSVIPALLKIAGPIQNFVKWWQALDESTRNQIGRWAAYAAAFALLGGALGLVAGTVLRLFAIFGRFLGFATGLGATFVVIGLAAAALTGHIRELSDILDVIVNFTFGSFTGFAISMGIVAVSAARLTKALTGLAGAEAAAGAGGMVGLFGRGKGAATGIKELFQVKRLEGAGRMMAGLAASAAMIPGPLWVAGAAIAAAAGGAFLWKRHMEQVRADAEFLQHLKDVGAAPRREFDVFQQLPKSVGSIQRTSISIRMMRRELVDLKKEASGATGRRRLDLLDQIQLQTLDIAEAQDRLQESNRAANRQFDAYTSGLIKFVTIGSQVKTLQSQLAGLQRSQARAPLTPGIADAIEMTRTRLRGLVGEMRTSAAGIEVAFKGVVSQLSKMGAIPKVSRGAMSDMFNISKRVGRALTIPEMKAIIKAEIDPGSRRRLPASIRAIFSQIRAQRIKVEVDQRTQQRATANLKKAQKAVPKAFKFPAFTFPDPSPGAKKARSKAAKVLTPLHQKVIVDPPTGLAQMGANIAAGIQAGIDANPVSVTVIKKVITKQLEIGSPSMWAAREVGKPIVQGIVLGILRQRGELEKTATIVANIFGGKVLSELDEKKKVTPKLLTKDLQGQLAQYREFNNALKRLARRGAPKELIDQLAELGPEAASKIAMLSRMSAPELRRYVQLWRKAQAEIKKSMRNTQEEIRNANKEFISGLAENIRGIFDQILSQNQQNFGELFSNIDPATYGEGFKQAMAEYESNVQDLQSQLSDLNSQLIDIAGQKRDQLAQAFGPLFSGEWLSGEEVQTKIEWGQKLGMDDLTKDLQSQLTKFNDWKKNLTQLAGKVPTDLAKALAALGPEAADKVAILNSATAPELAEYISLWKQSQGAIDSAAQSSVFNTQDIIDRTTELVSQIQQVTDKLAGLRMPHELTGEDIIKAVDDQIAQFVEYQDTIQALIDKGLPMQFIQQLEALGPAALPLLKGINSMSEAQLKDLVAKWDKSQSLIEDATVKMLNRQLKLWFSYGQNIAVEIINGISSQSAALSDYFTQMITSLLQGIRLPDPPDSSVNNPDRPGPPSSGGVGTGGVNWRGIESGSSYTYAPTINAMQSESLDATLQKQAFRFKTMVPG